MDGHLLLSVKGRLHKELIGYKLKEDEKEEKLKLAASRLTELDARLFKAQQRCDNKERQILNLRVNYIHRIGRARATISVCSAV